MYRRRDSPALGERFGSGDEYVSLKDCLVGFTCDYPEGERRESS